eukprot:31128-Pelagococcus_subviridis.AAC.3
MCASFLHARSTFKASPSFAFERHREKNFASSALDIFFTTTSTAFALVRVNVSLCVSTSARALATCSLSAFASIVRAFSLATTHACFHALNAGAIAIFRILANALFMIFCRLA